MYAQRGVVRHAQVQQFVDVEIEDNTACFWKPHKYAILNSRL